MKKLLFFCFAVLLNPAAFACLNGETKELTNGHVIYHDDMQQLFSPKGHLFIGINSQLLHRLDSLYQKTNDVNYLSDKGYVLIVLGKYKEAIDLYLTIEKTHPSRYSTASNIGTAYELMGKNDLALQWIKKSLLIAPSSHSGSEWIHVKILEAKIKGENASEKHYYLLHDFGDEPMPKTTLSNDSLATLRTQIAYQLNERMSFVKPKNKIVAALLFELGSISYLLNPKNKPVFNGKNETKEIYENALKYGFTDFIIKQRMALAEGKKPPENPRPREPNANWLIWPGAFLTLVIIFLAILSFRSKKNIKS